MKHYLLVIALFFAATGAAAQGHSFGDSSSTSEMNVDLPDETEETDLVKKGQWQLETQLLRNQYVDGRPSLLGKGMLRYGVTDRLELRLRVEEGRGRDRFIEETVQSTYPLALSAKTVLLKDKQGLPDITLVGYLKLPFTSRSSEQTIYWSPIALLAFQHKFGKKWKLEYNVGVQQEAYSTDWVGLVNASLHYKLIEPLELFAEYYAQYQPGEDPQHNVGGGIAYQLGNQLEFYISGGSTLRYDPANHFLSGGVAFRLPDKAGNY